MLPFRPELTWPADLYLEGSDQHRGWFQSSLLVGLGHARRAAVPGGPHPRLLRGRGRPEDVEVARQHHRAAGDHREERRRDHPPVGRRWWTTARRSASARRSWRASSRRTASCATRAASWPRTCTTSIRRTTRSRPRALEPVDRYILSRYADARARQARASYDAFDFQSVVARRSTRSRRWISARSTWTSRRTGSTRSAAQSPSRRAAQTAMFQIVDGLARLVAPILPVTAEQLWKALPGKRDVSVHLAEFPSRDLARRARRRRPGRRLAAAAGAARRTSTREIEARRKDKVFGTSLGGAGAVIGVGRRPGAAAEVRGRACRCCSSSRPCACRKARRASTSASP